MLSVLPSKRDLKEAVDQVSKMRYTALPSQSVAYWMLASTIQPCFPVASLYLDMQRASPDNCLCTIIIFSCVQRAEVQEKETVLLLLSAGAGFGSNSTEGSSTDPC